MTAITLEITQNCPNRCRHCSSNSSPEASLTISLAKICEVVDQAVALGIKKFIISGGEPLAHPELIDVISYISFRNAHSVLYTSGSGIEPSGNPTAISQKLIDNLIAAGLWRVNLSLHSHNSIIHDRFMGRLGSWARALQFAQQIADSPVSLHAHMVVIRWNYNDIHHLVPLLNSANFSALRLLKLVPQGRAISYYNALEPSANEWNIVRSQVAQLDANKSSKLKILLGSHLPISLYTGEVSCSIGEGKLTVMPDGSVAPCAALKDYARDIKSASIYRQSLNEVLNGDWNKRVRAFKAAWDPSLGCVAQQYYNFHHIRSRVVVR